jgi:hypothetical protein
MQKNINVYHNLGYWFLSLIVLVFAGFYTTYFSVLFQPRPAIIHIHFTLMVLWIAVLITQPFLIKYKKWAVHRLIGKISYVLVPLVLFFSYLLIRMGYYRYFNELHQQASQGLNHFTDAEILKKAADGPIAIFYFVWFALFYILAIINRRQSSVHARYMLATALTLLGPTVDRIIVLDFKVENIGYIPAYAISFLIADIVLSILLLKDFKNKRPVKTLATCLVIYITGQAFYFIVPGFDWWPSFMAFIMKPAP